ncbi:MAG: hypothetical protein ABIP06_06255 [Pyrinomonadaceae bacterium]
MTQRETKVFETEVVLFTGKQTAEVSANDEKKEVVDTVKSTIRTDIYKRFTGLRKSLRKRPASIL